MRKGRPTKVPEATSFLFRGVDMVQGPAQVSAEPGGLSVAFDERGIEIIGREPGERQAVSWADVQRVWLEGSDGEPGGRRVTSIEVESIGVTIRLLIDEDPERSVAVEALERCLLRWARRVRPARTPARPALRPVPLAAGASPGSAPTPSPESAPGGAPFPPPVVGPAADPGAMVPVAGRAGPPPARRRRTSVLLTGIALIVAGVGLALVLSDRNPSAPVASHVAPPAPSADQRTADRVMLTQADLPVGWKVDPTGPSGDVPPDLRQGEAAITGTFAGCMGISGQEASVLLGGRAADQTAQSSSPIFVAPSTTGDGSTLQLQTAASIVRTHADEQRDLAPFGSPHYPTCAATAIASELQLGVDDGSGGQATPATGSLIALPDSSGQRLTALEVTCRVSDHGDSVPVEVEAVFLGGDRIEANLEAFAVGEPIPVGAVSAPLKAFEQRVATRGDGTRV